MQTPSVTLAAHEASIEIAASPEAVYDLVSDVTRMGEWSPESTGADWIDGGTGNKGDWFEGHNKSGDYEWHADCEVTVADVGKTFAYIVPPDFEHTTTWGYDIESTGRDTCKVTEWFNAPMLALPDVYPGKIDGRCENLEKACRTTMENLRATFAG